MPTSGTPRPHARRLVAAAALLAVALGASACASGSAPVAVPVAAAGTSLPAGTPVANTADAAATEAASSDGASSDGAGGDPTETVTAEPTATATGAPVAVSTRTVTARPVRSATGSVVPNPSLTPTRHPTATFPRSPARTATTTTNAPPASSSSPAPVPGGTVHSARKGATLWAFDGAGTAFTDSGASWYYTWSPSGVSGVGGEFVPMIWGASSVTAANLARAKSAGRTLLGFNEPDLGGQANLSVEQALALWPQLQGTGLRLVSPAVAAGGATPGGWLDRFLTGAAAKGYRVDAIALHWYGGDFSAPNATAQLRQYLTAVHDRYRKPIWLTEYALMRFGPTVTPGTAQQAEFVTSSTAMLESLPFVERYAWFSFPTPKEGGLGTGLYSPGGHATPMGAAYRRAG